MSKNYDKTFSYFYHSQMKNCKRPYSSFFINLTLSYKKYRAKHERLHKTSTLANSRMTEILFMLLALI